MSFYSFKNRFFPSMLNLILVGATSFLTLLTPAHAVIATTPLTPRPGAYHGGYPGPQPLPARPWGPVSPGIPNQWQSGWNQGPANWGPAWNEPWQGGGYWGAYYYQYVQTGYYGIYCNATLAGNGLCNLPVAQPVGTPCSCVFPNDGITYMPWNMPWNSPWN